MVAEWSKALSQIQVERISGLNTRSGYVCCLQYRTERDAIVPKKLVLVVGNSST